MDNMKERQVELWLDLESMEEISEKIGKIRKKLWKDMENLKERQVE
jgi:biotin operon repressor